MAPERFAPILSPRQSSLFGTVTGLLLASGVILGGCATPTPVVEKADGAPAHLVVMNLTDYRWHITIAHSPAPRAADFEVEPRQSRSIDLASGEYSIRQTVLSEGAANELSRELPAKFAPGESYRWRLATLLSDTTEPPNAP